MICRLHIQYLYITILSFCAMDVQFEMIAFLTSGKQKYGHNICYPIMENLYNIG